MGQTLQRIVLGLVAGVRQELFVRGTGEDLWAEPPVAVDQQSPGQAAARDHGDCGARAADEPPRVAARPPSRRLGRDHPEYAETPDPRRAARGNTHTPPTAAGGGAILQSVPTA